MKLTDEQVQEAIDASNDASLAFIAGAILGAVVATITVCTLDYFFGKK
jgi:hypothetical protein